jgi:hypothetical protein
VRCMFLSDIKKSFYFKNKLYSVSWTRIRIFLNSQSESEDIVLNSQHCEKSLALCEKEIIILKWGGVFLNCFRLKLGTYCAHTLEQARSTVS